MHAKNSECEVVRKVMLVDIKRTLLNTPCRSAQFVTSRHMRVSSRIRRLKKERCMVQHLPHDADLNKALFPCCYRHCTLDCVTTVTT
eukprot:2352446-Amphidinium_carterae.1